MSLQISHTNWFFKWAYLINFQDTRDCVQVTTLCSLFWRCVFLTPLKLLILSLPVIGIGYVIATTEPDVLYRTAVFISINAAILTFSFYMDARARKKKERNKALGITPQPSFIGEAIRGIKERYCPLVRVVRHE